MILTETTPQELKDNAINQKEKMMTKKNTMKIVPGVMSRKQNMKLSRVEAQVLEIEVETDMEEDVILMGVTHMVGEMTMVKEILMEIEIDTVMVIEMTNTEAIVIEIVMETEIKTQINNSTMMIMDQKIMIEMEVQKIIKEVHSLILIWVLQHRIKMMIGVQGLGLQGHAHPKTKMMALLMVLWELMIILKTKTTGAKREKQLPRLKIRHHDHMRLGLLIKLKMNIEGTTKKKSSKK